jgi:putative ABC transport system permease protein
VLARYVVADLIRNPRRTLSTMVGVTLGVGLFCGVLFFVDGLAASMTQRAVAPLPIDMQRIVTERVGGAVTLTQTFEPPAARAAGDQTRVNLEVHNTSAVAANEVTVRSRPGDGLRFVTGSAQLDGAPLREVADNPFAHGSGLTGFNLGTIEPGGVRRINYLVHAQAGTEVSDATISSSFSSRESVSPVAANKPSTVPLDELAQMIAQVDGVAYANQLSLADLGPDTLSGGGSVARGPAKVFGFDAGYAHRDSTVTIVEGQLAPRGGVLSAEAAAAMSVGIGDTVTAALPDGSTLDLTVTGIADLTRARSLFSSRRGGDLETFIYSRNSITVSPQLFADTVLPAFERAATQRGSRLKNPPLREIDIALERHLLDADPATALRQTQRLGAEVSAVAAHQDYLLDNISNTLAVAAADADVAKRLFIFLGVPGCLLAAMLAAYAGTVLAAAQRREQATLRIRGASRRHLLRMLTLRSAALTAAGSAVGLVLGYVAVVVILGQESVSRASTSSLLTSALIGSVSGFLATGTALYLTGRRAIDREINEDRARLAERAPLWRRIGLDIIGVVVVAVGTAVALRAHAFDGAAGSVYFGRSVELNLPLLVLPVAVWIAGSLLAARVFGTVLARTQPRSTSHVGRPLGSLYRFSIGRRPWPIGNGAVVVSLIVALATSLGAFTASYDATKIDDARYATGSDIRLTPSPTSQRTYGVADADIFRTDGVASTSPVIYGVSNVILRSARTSDPANLAAIDPATYASVAPLTDAHFPAGDAAGALHTLQADPTAVLLSEDMASFLKAKPGDPLNVLLVRATPDQVEVTLHIVALFERLPGFPDGADAVMSIAEHTAHVPAKAPDFFLAAAATNDDKGLQRALSSLQQGPGASDALQIDTRSTTLARDQSSLAALNIAGLTDLDYTFALSMAVVTIAIFVFGLLLQRRREYITLRAQGLEPRTIRLLIAAEASTVAIGGALAGLLVGTAMGYYFVTVLRPLFVLTPTYTPSVRAVATPILLVLVATVISSIAASRLVNRLDPTELLRDD